MEKSIVTKSVFATETATRTEQYAVGTAGKPDDALVSVECSPHSSARVAAVGLSPSRRGRPSNKEFARRA
ncbi:hypothetical protein ACWGA9_14185 [Streptomyces sp. NPDC054950]|nr:hypothetical protein OV320_0123 [Actinobacteria bacterium OV320]